MNRVTGKRKFSCDFNKRMIHKMFGVERVESGTYRVERVLKVDKKV
jgi:hypothetical protein